RQISQRVSGLAGPHQNGKPARREESRVSLWDGSADKGLESALAAQQERRRIAQELHDDLGQSLALLQAGLRSLELASEDSATCLQLRQLYELSKQMSNELRNIAFRVRPTALDG